MSRKKKADTITAYSDGEIPNPVGVIEDNDPFGVESPAPESNGEPGPDMEATPEAFQKRRGRPPGKPNRPKAQDLPAMDGPGVGEFKDKKLDALCDEFVETRDQKAQLAENLGEIEAKILDRMGELELTVHRFSDQVATVKAGKNHIKIKTIKTSDVE